MGLGELARARRPSELGSRWQFLALEAVYLVSHAAVLLAQLGAPFFVLGDLGRACVVGFDSVAHLVGRFPAAGERNEAQQPARRHVLGIRGDGLRQVF